MDGSPDGTCVEAPSDDTGWSCMACGHETIGRSRLARDLDSIEEEGARTAAVAS